MHKGRKRHGPGRRHRRLRQGRAVHSRRRWSAPIAAGRPYRRRHGGLRVEHSRDDGAAGLMARANLAITRGGASSRFFRRMPAGDLNLDFFNAYELITAADIHEYSFRSEEHTSELQSLMRISY